MENLELILQNFDLYRILDLSKSATESDIKKAYYKKSLEFHPDKNTDSKNFYIINLAYKILSHPENRKKYDLEYYGNVKLTELETNLMNLKYKDYPIMFKDETLEKLKKDFNKISMEIIQEEKKKTQSLKTLSDKKQEPVKKVSETHKYVDKKVEDNLQKYKEEDEKLKKYLEKQDKIRFQDPNYFNNYFLKLKEKDEKIGININQKTDMELIPYMAPINFSSSQFVEIKDDEWEMEDENKEINIVEDVNTYSYLPEIQKNISLDLRYDVIHSRKSISKDELNKYSGIRSEVIRPTEFLSTEEFKKKLTFGFEKLDRYN